MMIQYFLHQITIVGGDGTAVYGVTTFLSQELAPNTDYTYRILAINGAGDGEVSPDMTFRTIYNGML